MVLECAWCRKIIRSDCNPPYHTSHGMCDDCHRKALNELREREPTRETVETVWGKFDIGGEA